MTTKHTPGQWESFLYNGAMHIVETDRPESQKGEVDEVAHYKSLGMPS